MCLWTIYSSLSGHWKRPRCKLGRCRWVTNSHVQRPACKAAHVIVTRPRATRCSNTSVAKLTVHSAQTIDNVIAKGFIPYITKPTRITSTTATLIDHLYSNHTHTEYDSGSIITDMTDHFGIFHLIYGIPPVHNIKYKQTRQLNECNILKFRNLLARADYTSVLSAIDPNEAYNNSMQIYKSLFEIS